jgi:hypothetical protein
VRFVPIGRSEKEIVTSLRIERRIEIDQVNALRPNLVS